MTSTYSVRQRVTEEYEIAVEAESEAEAIEIAKTIEDDRWDSIGRNVLYDTEMDAQQVGWSYDGAAYCMKHPPKLNPLCHDEPAPILTGDEWFRRPSCDVCFDYLPVALAYMEDTDFCPRNFGEE